MNDQGQTTSGQGHSNDAGRSRDMERRIQAHPWAETPLGSPRTWPQPLKTLVDLMLASNQAMFIAWGQQRALLYNDAYAEVLAAKHPTALGCDFLDVWEEIRADLVPIVEQAYSGQSVHMDDITLLMHRKGFAEETHFSFSYTPVRGEDGHVAGFFCPCNDITGQIMAERSQRAAEAAMRKSDTRLRDVLHSIGEAFVLLDRDFGVLEINPEGLRIDKRQREQIVGRTHWDVWPGTKDSELGRLYQKAMTERVPVALENRYVWQGSHEVWMDVRAYPSGEGLAIFYRDISERKQTEKVLEETAERYRLAVRATNDAVWDWNLGNHAVIWNEAVGTAFGHEEAARSGTSAQWWIDHIHPDDQARVNDSIHSVIDGTGTTWSEEYRFRRLDGSYADILDRGAVLRDHEGRPLRMIGAMQDLSERKRSEAALRASEEQLRLATEAAEIGLWDVDIITDTLFWPARVKAMFGISPDVPVSMADYYAGLHPDDREMTSAAFAAAADPERRALYDVEYRTVGKEDGLIRWVAAKGRGVFDDAGRCIRILGTAIDITARREQIEAVESARRLLDAVLEAMPVGVIIADASGAVSRTNSANSLLWGETPRTDSVEQYRQWIGYWPETGERIEAHEWAMARALESGEICQGELIEIERFDGGGRRFIINSAAPVRDRSNRIVAGIVAQLDVTERVRAERALQALNDTLEHQVAERTAERDRVWRNSRDLLIVIGADGVFRAVNPAWQAILGHRPEAVVGRSFLDFIWPEDAALTRLALNDAVAARHLTNFENRFTHKDGTPRWISWHTSLEGEFVYAYGRDITAEKEQAVALEQIQEALRQSQKMEAVGQLTGGIAHDFNNMLAVVIGSLDLLERRIGVADARAKRYVDAANEGARRAATLTQRLLAFSRQQPLKPEPIEANKLVAGISELIRGSLGSDIRLETVLASGLWHSYADPNQLENALLNLAVNARDAMPDGGRLTVETANAHLDARYVAAHIGVPAGQYVMIAVTDTGSGMSAEVIAKAFDPFFTTKGVGKGTGLGLSQVYGFVKQSGGHVKIYSEAGQGTTVKIYLPRYFGDSSELPLEEKPAVMSLGEEREVILVVEDEPAVRQLSTDALTELGYRVLAADSAAAALNLLDSHPEITLLFTDIVMPDVNGAKLAQQALKRRPDLKVLFTTGYTRNAVVHNGVLDPGVELIGKPFTIEELAARVREVLDRPTMKLVNH